jgi:hypothetical protein
MAKTASARHLEWRTRTDRKRVEVWLPVNVASALDGEVKAGRAAGRGEAIAHYVEAAQGHQGVQSGEAHHQGQGEERARLGAVRALAGRWEAKAGWGPRWEHALDLLGDLRKALGDGGSNPASAPPPDVTVHPLPQGQALKLGHAVVYVDGQRIGTCWRGREGWYAEPDRDYAPAGKPPVPLQAEARQEAAEKLAAGVQARGRESAPRNSPLP